MKKLVFVCFLAMPVFFLSCIKEPEMYDNTYRGNFDALWEIIDRRYCFLDYKNIDWDSVYAVYSPRVDTIHNNWDFFSLLGDMLDVLKDGHVNLISNFDVSRYWDWYLDYDDNFDDDILYSDRYLGDDYRKANGLDYKIFDSGRIGYIYYSSFSESFNDTNIAYALSSFSDCYGLIIDVRDNGGGFLDLAERMVSYFIKEKTLVGYYKLKTGYGHSDFSKAYAVNVSPNGRIYWGRPVIILTNRRAYSATNDFVSYMKGLPNVSIVGDKTGGGGGAPFSSELVNGWRVRFSAYPSFNRNMQMIENGIEPDYHVSMSKEDMEKGYDSIIEFAMKLIRNKMPSNFK